jgi:S-DNA-T family DNA segregation ATPase FtsK/SpoIIIE
MVTKKLISLLKHFIRKSAGTLLILMSGALLLSIITYSEHDPSFNVSTTSGRIENIFGKFGAYTSDIIIQSSGLVSFAFCIMLLVLGFKIIRKTTKTSSYLKLVSSIIFLISAPTFLSGIFTEINPWGNETWGGAIGFFITSLIPLYLLYPALIFTFILSIISFSIILDITPRNWKTFFGKIYLIIKFTLSTTKKAILFLLPNELSTKLSKQKQKAPKVSFMSKMASKAKEKIADHAETKRLQKIRKTKEVMQEPLFTAPTIQKTYKLPPTGFLKSPVRNSKKDMATADELRKQSTQLYNVLQDFGVKGQMLGCSVGPIITLHEFEPSAGTRASRVIGLSDDISRSMSAVSTRISIVPGRNAMGIELPNQKREIIYLREMLESDAYKNTQATLPIILGKSIGGHPVIADLERMPHLLVAGTTGSGKSVAINAMILSLLYKMSPDECKFIMVDPKMLELSVYKGIPHLLAPVVTEAGKAVVSLKWVTHEMEDRYRAMSGMGVRNIKSYNEKIEESIRRDEKVTRTVQTGFDLETGEPKIEKVELKMKKLPYIVVIVDEMADLMIVAGKEIESSIQRLAQMARAAGIHIIMATQRPSVDVITGVIKANFPTRISFQVTSKIDSRTILGEQGAEQLLGMGDMLYMSSGSKITRAHGPFVSDSEISNIVSFIKKQGVKPDYVDDVTSYTSDGGYGVKDSFEARILGNKAAEKANNEAELYKQAVEIVRRDNKPSISYIQRQLRIGYNKAANLIERMEQEGVVTEAGRNGKREVIK